VPLPRGTSYHMMVIIGYDDNSQEFIVNDTGDKKDGKNHRYDYELFMNSLHDFDFTVHKANGPARVIFTYPKLVKTADSPKVYYIHDFMRQYVPNETIFKAKGWKWEAVNLVENDWLGALTAGKSITITN
jgi:hypothetical protein